MSRGSISLEGVARTAGSPAPLRQPGAMPPATFGRPTSIAIAIAIVRWGDPPLKVISFARLSRHHVPTPLEVNDPPRYRHALRGVRGRPAFCKRALVDLIQRLSMMLADLSEIEELDLNPVLVFADSVWAVDGRIRVGALAAA